MHWVLSRSMTAVWLTFTDWNLIRPPRYVGFDNILQLGKDKLFWQSLKVTSFFPIR